MQWQIGKFESLTNQQIYDFLQLREQVFTFDQNCDEVDIDGVDIEAWHQLGYKDNLLIAYCRFYKKEDSIYIGRIVVNPDYQGKGIGRKLMDFVLNYLQKNHPNSTIKMSAQSYLKKFYESFGFIQEGNPYSEGGIEHISMSMRAASKKSFE